MTVKYDVFNYTFHSVGKQILKDEADRTDTMRFIFVNDIPDCDLAMAQELSDKLDVAREKYGAPFGS
jgi:hypothetical protein